MTKATDRCDGQAPIEVPAYVSPIAVIYNLEGVDDLKLSPATLAAIFAGDITSWDDERIAQDNPDADLPAESITPVHRSDDSGTTQNFTEYLTGAAPGVWKLKSGSTVEWPSDTQAGQGNGGVAQIIKATNGAIGYVDLSDAKASGMRAEGPVAHGIESPPKPWAC